MGLYILLDAASTFSGDFQLDTKGDIGLADSFNTQLSAANFWLRTDHADYAAGTDVGANLGEYIGGQNTEDTLESMKDQTFDSLVKNLFYPEDIRVEAVPFDLYEALVALEIKGEYLDENGEFVSVTPQILTYLFPYIDGEVFPT
jgi:hypothetical protein